MKIENIKFAYSNDSVKSSQHINHKINFEQLIKTIRNASYKSKYKYSEIKKVFKTALKDGKSMVDAKKLIEADKKALHFFLLSGYCAKGHSIENIEYNGIFQLDFDFKYSGGDVDAVKLKELLSKEKYILLAANSITQGVKAIIRTNNTDKKFHFDLMEKFKDRLESKYKKMFPNMLIDKLQYNQICFVPFDKDVFFNRDAEIIDVSKCIENIKAKELHELSKRIENKRVIKELKNNNSDFNRYYNSKINKLDFDELICSAAYSGAKDCGSGFPGTHQAYLKYSAICNYRGVGANFAYKYLSSRIIPTMKLKEFERLYKGRIEKSFGIEREDFINRTIKNQFDYNKAKYAK